MKAGALLVVVLLVPGIAAGQSLTPLPPSLPAPIIEISPKTPPPPTIPTAPEVVPPALLPATNRPVKLFDFRATLGGSEEFSDNFNRSSQHPVSNLRSMVSPGFRALLDSGFLTGQATYTLSGFHDSSVNEFGVHHYFAGDLAWQATPRLKFTVTEALTKSDNPTQADRLDLRLARQEYTSNVLSLGSAYTVGLVDTKGYYVLSTFTSDQATTTSHTLGVSASTPLRRIHTLTLGYEYLDSETTVPRGAPVTFFGPTADSTITGHQLTATVSRDLTANRTVGLTAAYALRDQILTTGHSTFTRWNVSAFNNYVVTDKLILRGNLGIAQLEGGGANGRPLLTSNSDLTYYLGPLILGFTVERGFAESFGQGQNLGVVETSGYSGWVTYRYSPLLSGGLTGSYRENKFTGLGAAGQGRRDDTTISVTANVTYQVLRWLSTTLDYTYTHTDTNAAQSGFTGFVENRIRAAVNLTLY